MSESESESESEVHTVGGLRRLVAERMGKCGLAVACLTVEYAMSDADEAEHDRYLGGGRERLQWPRLYAAKYGDLRLLQWAIWAQPLVPGATPLPEGSWGAEDVQALAEGGHLGMLRWARQKGCPFGTAACCFLAQEGNLVALRWARAVGIPMYSGLCWEALRGRHGEVIRWCLAREPEWRQDAGRIAASIEDSPALLEWAVANGAELGPSCCRAAAVSGNFDVFRWLHIRGCSALHFSHCSDGLRTVAMKVIAAELVKWADRWGPQQLGAADRFRLTSDFEFETGGRGWTAAFGWVRAFGVSVNEKAAAAIYDMETRGLPKSVAEWDAYRTALMGVIEPGPPAP